MDRIYITTPLYYVNAEPHLGSAYTMIITDTLARYYRANGWEAFYLTGTDEHGDKIAQAAAQAGMDPKPFTDQISATFQAAWDSCGFSYDHFIRTTDAYHVGYVQELLTKVYEAGDIYFDRYGGLYCFGCERFYTEKELVDGKCPDHRTVPELIEEENYFFRMSKYQDRLLRHLEEHPDFIRPEGFKNEVAAMLREPIGDLCISRPKSRLTWGIEIPFDQRYVTYVWFDALINYVSALKHRGGEFFEKFWPQAEHFIGKDILKPHGIFWPTMLMAAGLPLYKHLNVHGFWTSEGQKMSKSLGNTVSPLEMKERIGMDAFRYFVLRESVFGQDADFREDALTARYNADLANNLGNLISRVLAMQKKYFSGIVQSLSGDWPKKITHSKINLLRRRQSCIGTWRNSSFIVPSNRFGLLSIMLTAISCRPRRLRCSGILRSERGSGKFCIICSKPFASSRVCSGRSCRIPQRAAASPWAQRRRRSLSRPLGPMFLAGS